MANTTNFGWETPDDTDLVKDGASAMRTLGNAIDTSLVDLKGGTTGQVLSKASNTDMDFTWVAQDDSNAIQNAIVDAKGDLITATAADTPARLAVGTNGQVLQADSTTSTGLKWADSSSGSMTLLSTTTLSGTSTTISGISSAYNDLIIFMYGLTNSTSDSFPRIYPNNSLDSTTGRNNDAFGFTYYRLNRIIFNQSGLPYLRTSANNALSLTIKNYASTSTMKPYLGSGIYLDISSDTQPFMNFGGVYSTTAISSLTITMDNASTFNSGTVLIYGVK